MGEPYPGYRECCARWAKIRDTIDVRWAHEAVVLARKELAETHEQIAALQASIPKRKAQLAIAEAALKSLQPRWEEGRA